MSIDMLDITDGRMPACFDELVLAVIKDKDLVALNIRGESNSNLSEIFKVL